MARWPELADAVELLRPRTTWGFAFRYPRDADIPAEEPSAAEIRDALRPLAALRDHLVRLVDDESDED